jgi:endonuclease/exonuclease/phosphatase family metal-dependent hydrolase
MRVMTWNIHGGVGMDGRFDLARIVDAIAHHAPDVVALQEVDSRRRAAQGPSPFTFLREAIGQHGIEAKSITTADGDYGQMVISRWPLQAVQIHDITVAQREPRRAIQTDVIAPAGTVRLIAAHFGLRPSERRTQARRLVAIGRPHPSTTVMLGDFNDWFWPSSMRAALERELPAHTRHATYPSRWPLMSLDRVYCWPARALLRSYVDRKSWIASDHLGLVADIALGQT